jgi:chromosome segregation protein
MYLEKLELQGFKSFANKNKIIFPGLVSSGKKGLTSIVGPNGSGKSNIADSIRWVLGEQSLKTLRGKKSEDVIFSGSDQKHQLSLAEVSLFFNNEDQSLWQKNSELENLPPVEDAVEESQADFDKIKEFLKQPEIILTRRLYRTGDSEYLINNNRVRLADIQMLLAKANVGQKTYSVIGQGMVENFLNTTASDRKDFFDEATGIKQFQIKRDLSLNKLENSYENLQQVEMLLTEIRPRLKSLTRQVERLKKRESLETDLRAIQLNYYGFLYREAETKLNNNNRLFLDLEKDKNFRSDRLAKLNQDLDQLRSSDNFQAINDLQPQIKALETEKNQYIKQLAHLQAELENKLDSQGQFDISWLNNKQSELKTEAAGLMNELEILETQKQAVDNTSLQTALTEINRKIEHAYEIKRQIDRKEEEKNQQLKQITRLEAVLETNLEAQGQFDISWLNNKHEELQKDLTLNEKEISDLRKNNADEESKRQEKLLAEVEHNINRLNQEAENIKKELRTVTQQAANRAEISRIVEEFLAGLDAVKEENDIIKIKKLIETAKNNFQIKIKEFIADENDEKLQRIKEIQDEIISLTENRQAINNRWNEERLRLSSLNERLRLLSEKRDQLNREITDIEAKISKSQVKFDATAIETEKNNIFSKIEQIEQEIRALLPDSYTRDLQEKKQQIISQMNDEQIRVSSLKERSRLLSDKKDQLNREIVEIEAKISKSQVKFDATAIETEKDDLIANINRLDKDIKEKENSIRLFNEAKEKEKVQLFDCQKNIQALQQEINQINNELSNRRIESARQETRLEDLENNIRNDGLDFSEIKKVSPTISQADLESSQKKINDYKNQLETIGGIDPETEKEYGETKNRYDFLSSQINDLNAAIKSLEKVISELDGNIKDKFDREFKNISEKFSEYFKILFNGGQAKIFKLTENDLNLENNNPGGADNVEPEADQLKRIRSLRKKNALGLAGIEIQATPPGKKIQTVSMLSGGERALTAIALICAIISANPSPFVVLDEVDAALDEANSERLAQILDDLSDKTQFIVITHNRASMKRATILYGVTMQADGISKLLSVKLEEVSSRQGAI